METICATGIRVSEVQYITVESAKKRRAQISMKGKLRTILIPAQLCRKLRRYAVKRDIRHGELFLTKYGTRLSRKQIWAQMKALCKYAGYLRPIRTIRKSLSAHSVGWKPFCRFFEQSYHYIFYKLAIMISGKHEKSQSR